MLATSTKCSGLPCPIDSEEAVCINEICLCENSLFYNRTRRCDSTGISTPHPLRVCGTSYSCDAGIPPLYETCVNARCLVLCNKNSECRQINAFCVSGICICNYGMVMSAEGCDGLKYLPPPDQSAAAIAAPTLGFWVYAAIIGAAILGSAIILVVVHALFSIRPVQLETRRHLTMYPEVTNPFAPERVPSIHYSRSRRSPLTSMIEKRYNLKPIKQEKSINSLRRDFSINSLRRDFSINSLRRDFSINSLRRDFSDKHPELIDRLNDPDRHLSPSLSSTNSSSQLETEHLSSDNQSLASVPRNAQRKVTWTSSTKLDTTSDEENEKVDYNPRADEEIGVVQENAQYSIQRLQSLVPDSQPKRYNQRRPSTIIQSLPEEYIDMGLGRVGNRLSIVK